MAIVAIAIVGQLVGWSFRGRILTRRHRKLRLATGFVLLAILALIAWGLPENLFHLFAYWAACALLILSLVVLALLDVRETLVSYAERYVELTHSLLEEEKRNRQSQ